MSDKVESYFLGVAQRLNEKAEQEAAIEAVERVVAENKTDPLN